MKTEGMNIPDKIREVCELVGISTTLALAIAEVESTMGKNQLSKTGARGVFQMTSIAMKDLLQEMEKKDDDWIDIMCGVLYLRVLLRRWKDVETAVKKYCDSEVRDDYWAKVSAAMDPLAGTNQPIKVDHT